MISPFSDSTEHLLTELKRIDSLIQMQVLRARQTSAADHEFRGLVITEDEVDALLAAPGGLPVWAIATEPWPPEQIKAKLESLALEISRRKAASVAGGITLRLHRLIDLFELTPFDVDVLLICLAPELDLRYERLYAYLHDDVTKRRPSVDLALNLLSPSFAAKLTSRQRFADSAPLVKHCLVSLFDDPSHPQPPLLAKHLKVDERVVGYLLGQDDIDPRLQTYARCVAPQAHLDDLALPQTTKQRLVSLARTYTETNGAAILYLHGPNGAGKETIAAALCHQLGLGLLTVDGENLLHAEGLSFDRAMHLAIREARLQDAALYWAGFDALLDDEHRARSETLWQALSEGHRLSFLAGNTAWEPAGSRRAAFFVRVELARPDHAQSVRLWTQALNGDARPGADVDPNALAAKFRFTAGQIEAAAATARNLALWRDPEDGQATMDDLYAACRLQSNRKLATLARKITPHYCWDDIVLPADRMSQLREICNTIKYRTLVYDDWGFDGKLALGKGLNVLFAGPSGTGKTMAAEIIAGELGLELYKIDLSTVVSKYIGETEKNLARIFAEAETSNAILFFDEADALFGKRSQVRDSHDRYANIEIAYLLQKMEEYDGVVILATNLSRNIDDAFVRRMHATIEFPFPDEQDRQRIWERIWPGETPLHPDLDLGFLAQRFEIAGGNIRNVALSAAFFAADNGRSVTMAHLMHAIKREYQKMGKVVVDGEFGDYSRLAGK